MVHGTARSSSWTEDLPKCPKTGTAMARNGRYKPDGKVDAEHEYEDRHLCVRYDNDTGTDTCLYGVFDGHDGSPRAAEYAQDKFPADLLYERLPKAQTERDLCSALQQSFLAVERGFFASLDASLARRASIRGQLPAGLNDYQLSQRVPHLVSELQGLNEAITGGTTAALALIHNNSLFAANVGDSRVVLSVCRNSVLPMIAHPSGGLLPNEDLVEAHQLTLDHNTDNAEELDRLVALGLHRDRMQRNGRVGSHENTRSIGDYSLKGGYREFDEVKHALGEPLIADPFIQRALPVQSNWLFMFLMSDGVYRAVEEAHGLAPAMANMYIARIISYHLKTSKSIQEATELALHYILTDHLTAFLSGDKEKAVSCRKRDDCTLLVRCFHHAVPNLEARPPSPSPQQPPASPPPPALATSPQPLALPAQPVYNCSPPSTSDGSRPTVTIPSAKVPGELSSPNLMTGDRTPRPDDFLPPVGRQASVASATPSPTPGSLLPGVTVTTPGQGAAAPEASSRPTSGLAVSPQPYTVDPATCPPGSVPPHSGFRLPSDFPRSFPEGME